MIAQNFDPTSLWPNATTASDNINAGAVIVQPLFWVNPASGKPEPLLAEGMTWESPTTIRIRLRAGIKFTNGEPMDAAANPRRSPLVCPNECASLAVPRS